MVEHRLAGGPDGARPAHELDDSFHAPPFWGKPPGEATRGGGNVCGLSRRNRLGLGRPGEAVDPAGSASDDDERSAPSGSSPPERSAFLLGQPAPHAGVLARLHGPFETSHSNWASTANGFGGFDL
jgi:hypothetical protein